MKRVRHVTLDDIAKRLHVSRVTVSKALRGHPDISTSMTKLVEKTAHELGYLPNIMARSLSSRRSNMIGVVVPKIAHFFFGSVIEGIYNTAFDNNFETILTVSQENPQRETKHLQTLGSMRVGGIIISITQTTRDLSMLLSMQRMGIPVLFVDRRPEPPLPGFSSVTVDDKGGAFKAVEQAIKSGYRKIGCIGGNPNINIGKERLAGLESALNQYGVPLNREWIVGLGFDKKIGYDALMQFHATGDLPEFIFAMTYPVALGVYEAAKELGLAIPDDIDVISFGDSDVGRVISPALSCVSQPSYEQGVKAVEMMLKMIEHSDVSQEQHIVLPTELILRETCASKPATSKPVQGAGTSPSRKGSAAHLHGEG
jgi:LacI family transcriptional regulator